MDSDDDFVVDRLSKTLAHELREVSEVSFSVSEPAEGDKGTGELVLATLNILTAVDPAQIEAVLRILGNFRRRHPDRKIRVEVGDARIEIDNPSEKHVDELVDAFLAAARRRTR
ncbi:hypothetical protein [Kribbella sp.]|uniref:hypothetical protein n=1 Tax=Kribbella sp. TaxID=1871183 RepID=UPI002D4A981F|nr:hypothetical protein [Kribbella sp.]HZX07654.1 hypothetical protein [Kribbella sp.]